MDTFNIGDIVTLSSDIPKDYTEIRCMDDVREAFGGQTPIGTVCAVKSRNIVSVNWGIHYHKFHTCYGTLPNYTGYHLYGKSLRKMYATKYDPNQEPEDDCL